MTEEEKKAIEFLNNYIKDNKEDIKILNSTIDEDIDYYNEVAPIERRLKYLETIKNLIEKLQKENGELKEKKLIDRAMIEDSISKGIVERDYISKDKIREKLERLENQKENYKKQPLIYMLLKNQYKELLEEE